MQSLAPQECKWSCLHPVPRPEPRLLSLSPPLLPAFSLSSLSPMLRIPDAGSRSEAPSRQRGEERQAPNDHTRRCSELELQPSPWLSEEKLGMHCSLFFQAPGTSSSEEKGVKFVFLSSSAQHLSGPRFELCNHFKNSFHHWVGWMESLVVSNETAQGGSGWWVVWRDGPVCPSHNLSRHKNPWSPLIVSLRRARHLPGRAASVL